MSDLDKPAAQCFAFFALTFRGNGAMVDDGCSAPFVEDDWETSEFADRLTLGFLGVMTGVGRASTSITSRESRFRFGDSV